MFQDIDIYIYRNRSHALCSSDRLSNDEKEKYI